MKKLLIWLTAALALSVLSFNAVFAQVANNYSGILTVMWGDPKPGSASGGAMLFELTTPDGTAHPLVVDPTQQSTAVQFFGKRVTVTGRETESLTGGPSTIAVDSIAPADRTRSETPNVAGATTRKVLFVLLKFKDDAQETHPPKFYKDLTNPLTPPAGSVTPATINGFFVKTSWGKLQWKADVVGQQGLASTHWLTLPKTKTGYANCGWNGSCANLTLLRNDALALVAGKGIDYTQYDNINFVVNNDLDCCAWGGSFSNGMKIFGQTFEPPWSQEAGVYVHEMGHSIGLPHSGWLYYDYDSHHDQMSRGNPAQTVNCGSYNSVNDGAVDSIFCTEPGAGYIVAHKDYLGWLPPANKATVNTVSAQNFIIEANALPLGSRLKMVKICITGVPCSGANGSTAHFLTLEAKLTSAKYENGLPTQGLVVHDVKMNRAPIGANNPCYFNSQSGWALPLDATPGDFNKATCSPKDVAGHGLMNMPFVAGQGLTSGVYHVAISVLKVTANTITVRVKKTK